MAYRKFKMRTGRSKRFSRSTVNTGPSKVAGFMNDQKEFVPLSLGSRSQVAKGGEGYSKNHEYLLNKYPAPPTLEEMKPHQIVAKAMLGNPRAVVLTQLMQGKFRGQKERAVHSMKLSGRVTLFIGDNILFFVKEEQHFFNHSITYSTLERAMRAWKTGQVFYPASQKILKEISPPKAD